MHRLKRAFQKKSHAPKNDAANDENGLMPMEEIAKIMGISIGTVHHDLTSALAKLRKIPLPILRNALRMSHRISEIEGGMSQ